MSGAGLIDVTTTAEAEQRATLDYLAASDTMIEVDEVNGFDGEDSYNWNTYEVGDGTPIRVRVLETSGADLAHWNTTGNHSYLDPYWNVELAEPHCAVPKTARSLWVYAPTSYRVLDDSCTCTPPYTGRVTSAGDRGSK